MQLFLQLTKYPGGLIKSKNHSDSTYIHMDMHAGVCTCVHTCVHHTYTRIDKVCMIHIVHVHIVHVTLLAPS